MSDEGYQSFHDWFRGFENQYAIIEGTACEILMTEEGLDFRATKDIDIVLIVETLTSEFVLHFWDYIKIAGYEHRSKSTGKPEFYRFTNPKSKSYPAMIELFSKKSDLIELQKDVVLTPLPMDEGISSLSAILLDDVYYDFLKLGLLVLDGLSILDAEHLIPFKIKAWLDLTERRLTGEHIDSKNIRKHRNDVFRLFTILNPSVSVKVSATIFDDIHKFIHAMDSEFVDLKQLGVLSQTKEEVLNILSSIYKT